MALTFGKLFEPLTLGTSAATPIYTVPSAPTTSLLLNGRVQLTNTSSAAVAATLNAVPFGSTAAVANQILPAVSIAPNASIPVDIPQLKAGDFLNGFAGTAGAIAITPLDGTLQS